MFRMPIGVTNVRQFLFFDHWLSHAFETEQETGCGVEVKRDYGNPKKRKSNYVYQQPEKKAIAPSKLLIKLVTCI